MNGKSSDDGAQIETGNPLLASPEPGRASPSAIKHLILDCSTVSFVDLLGAKCLATLESDLKKEQVSLIMAACSAHVIEQLERCGFFSTCPRENLYPSVLDAVLSVRHAELHGVEQP